jgi:hypothetical protein
MNKFLLYVFIVVSAVVTRLVPHEWNFAPVTAVAIVAAAYLPLRQAMVLTLAIRFISDAIIGFFAWPLMAAVYASHLFGVVMGRWIKNRKTIFKVLAAPAISAVVFFLVTNFAFLYPSYPHNLAGIVSAYLNGLPFFKGTLLGDVFYTAALIGVYEAVLLWQKNKRLKFNLSYDN